MYLTQSEFDLMDGELEDDELYPRLEYRARAAIDSVTCGRLQALEEIPESVKWAMFDCITLLASVSSGAYDVLPTSVSNDGVSVTYSRSNTSSTEVGMKLLSIIRSYLSTEVIDGVPLLYAGVT